MLITCHSYPVNSRNDEKVFEKARVHGVGMIVTTRDYAALPVRFISNFSPVALRPISEPSASFVGRQLLTHFEFEPETAKSIVRMAATSAREFPTVSIAHDILTFVQTFCSLKDKSAKQILRTGLVESFAVSLHRYAKGYFEGKLPEICSALATTPELRADVENFLKYKDLYYPRVEETSIVVEVQPILTKTQELRQCLKNYNSRSNEKLIAEFSSHVVRQWSLLYRTITFPGRNAVLHGRTGSGRFTLTKIVAAMCEYEFVAIPEMTSDDLIAPIERRNKLFAILRDVVNLIIGQKHLVLFVRATRQNRFEAELITHFVSCVDFGPFFESAEEVYTKVSGGPSLNVSHRQTLFEQVRELIRRRLHAVIALEDDAGYSLDLARFDQYAFNSDSPEAFTSVILDALPRLSEIVGLVPPRIPTLFTAMSDIARGFVPSFHPNMFYDFVDSFIRVTVSEYNAIVTKNENIEKTLRLIKELHQEKEEVSARFAVLSPQLHQLQLDTETMHASYTQRKDAIETRRVKLEEEHNTRSQDVASLEEKVKTLDAEIAELAPKASQTAKDVLKLTDNDIATIRITATDPAMALRLLMELFCLFLDLPQSYERNGQKLLMDKNFLPTVVKRMSSCTMTTSFLDDAYKYFEHPEMSAAKLESIAPALRILYDWVESGCRLARLKETSAKAKTELENRSKELVSFDAEVALELTSIDAVEQSLAEENQTIIVSQAKQEKAEGEYKVIDGRNKTLEALFKDVSPLLTKWENESSEFQDRRDQSLGDAVLFSFYLVFCGLMNNEDKMTAMKSARDLIVENGLKTSPEGAMELVRDRFLFSIPNPEQSNETISAQIDAQHVMSSNRCPLLIDPDGIVTNIVTESIKPQKRVVISQNCSYLDGILASAITDGKTLILLDIEKLNSCLAQGLTLSLLPSQHDISREIKIGGRTATWNSKFKLVLISWITDLPDSLLSRVNVINVTWSSAEATWSAFVRTFIEFFEPDLCPGLTEVQKRKIGKRVQTDRYERETLATLVAICTSRSNDAAYDCLGDEPVMTKLINSKDGYIQSLQATTTDSKLEEEVKTRVKPFKKHIKLCQTFWLVLSRELTKINSSTVFLFGNYQKTVSAVFLNDGLHPGQLSNEQHNALSQSLFAATFQFVCQSLTIREVMFFMFIAGCKLQKQQKLKSEDTLGLILKHVREELCETCDFFSGDAAPGDSLDRLKYANLINIFHFVSQFLSRQFGEDYTSFFPHFQVDSVITTAASIPSFVLSKPKHNPTSLIQHFVGLRCRNENLDCISLTRNVDDIRNCRKIVQAGMSRGNWVILHYTHPCAAAAAMLADLWIQMSTTTLNTNFRLIVIVSSPKFISKSILARSKRIQIETFPSIRNTMLQLFHHHSVSIDSTTNSRGMKKLAYVCGMLLSIVNYRNFIEPSGFATGVRPNKLIFKDVINQLQIVIDTNPNDIPLRNLRTQIEKLVYSGISDGVDRRRISAHVASILIPDALEDGFSIAPKSSDPEKLQIPADVPLSNFTQIIQQLPLFAKSDDLRMNADLFLKLNLSLWIMRPLVKYDSYMPTIDWSSLTLKINAFKELLPQTVNVTSLAQLKGSVGHFLLSEVSILNDILRFVRTEVAALEFHVEKQKTGEVAAAIWKDRLPKKWSRATGIIATKLTTFTSHIVERHAQLIRCMQEDGPVVFDMRVLENPRRLLEAFLNDVSMEMSVPFDTAKFEFSVVEGMANIEAHALYLTRAIIASGDIKARTVTTKLDKSAPPVRTISSIQAKVVTRVNTKAKVAPIPMFKQAFIGTEGDGGEMPVVHGESANLVWTVTLQCDGTESGFDLGGTALFCRVPDQLL
jgi:hypothetical protein